MSVNARVRYSRAGIQKAAKLGFRKSGYRSRFLTGGKAAHSQVPPSWYTQTLCLSDIRVNAGQLRVLDLGTVCGPSPWGQIELWGLRYFDAGEGDFVDVTNDLGTQFYNVVFKIVSDRGLVFTTRNLIRRGWKDFKTFFVGGERLNLYVWNLQANDVQFNLEVTLNIETMQRVDDLLYGKI